MKLATTISIQAHDPAFRSRSLHFRANDRVQIMSKPSDAIVVFITAPTQEEAKRLADRLVEASLAACVQILPQMESVYRWEGKVERQSEHLLIVKTTAERFTEVEKEVRLLHSYETPEIVCFPLTAGSPEYLNWLRDSVEEKKPNP